MLKSDRLKEQTNSKVFEENEVQNKIKLESENLNNELEILKKKYNESSKKIRDNYNSKINILKQKQSQIKSEKIKIAGELYFCFLENEITQDELNELTQMLKS